MTTHDALLRAISSNPSERTPQLVLADWYAEHDRYTEEAQCRLGVAPVGLVFFGHGDGHGSGDGHG